MKRLSLMLTVLAVVGVVASSALADDGDRSASRSEAREFRSSDGAVRIQFRAHSADGRTRIRTERAEASDRRSERVREALEARGEEMRKWQEKHRELTQLHRESVEKLGRDHAATKAIAAELREHLQARRELGRKMVEQMRRQAEARRATEQARPRARRPHERPFAGLDMGRLNLTERQQRQIRRIMINARRRIVEDVLTDEQRKELERTRPERPTRHREDRTGPRREMRRDREREREDRPAPRRRMRREDGESERPDGERRWDPQRRRNRRQSRPEDSKE